MTEHAMFSFQFGGPMKERVRGGGVYIYVCCVTIGLAIPPNGQK